VKVAVLEHGSEHTQLAHLQVPGQAVDQGIGGHPGDRRSLKSDLRFSLRGPKADQHTKHYHPMKDRQPREGSEGWRIGLDPGTIQKGCKDSRQHLIAAANRQPWRPSKRSRQRGS
jgi:hypothetical protein